MATRAGVHPTYRAGIPSLRTMPASIASGFPRLCPMGKLKTRVRSTSSGKQHSVAVMPARHMNSSLILCSSRLEALVVCLIGLHCNAWGEGYLV